MRITAVIVLAMCVSTGAYARGGGSHGSSHSSHSSKGSKSSSNEHHVAAHTTNKGTYVAGHHSTNPNGTKRDNWTTKGNVNPHTGKEGTRDPNARRALKND